MELDSPAKLYMTDTVGTGKVHDDRFLLNFFLIHVYIVDPVPQSIHVWSPDPRH